MTDQPRISIVTVNYNQGRFLERAMMSVLSQGYPDLEYIVIDGGSSDESVAVIRKHEDRLAYWVSEADRGQSHALNKGFARCTGQLMGWLNSDDYFLPGAFDRFVDAWRSAPECGGWVGQSNRVSPEGKRIMTVVPGKLDGASLADWEKNGFAQPACLFSKAAWDACGPIDESLFIAMDLDLWLKMAARFSFHGISAAQTEVVVHPSAKTQAHMSRKYMEMWKVLKRHGFDDQAEKSLRETLDDMDSMRRKVEKLTNLRVYRLFRPIVKRFLR